MSDADQIKQLQADLDNAHTLLAQIAEALQLLLRVSKLQAPK